MSSPAHLDLQLMAAMVAIVVATGHQGELCLLVLLSRSCALCQLYPVLQRSRGGAPRVPFGWHWRAHPYLYCAHSHLYDGWYLSPTLRDHRPAGLANHRHRVSDSMPFAPSQPPCSLAAHTSDHRRARHTCYVGRVLTDCTPHGGIVDRRHVRCKGSQSLWRSCRNLRFYIGGHHHAECNATSRPAHFCCTQVLHNGGRHRAACKSLWYQLSSCCIRGRHNVGHLHALCKSRSHPERFWGTRELDSGGLRHALCTCRSARQRICHIQAQSSVALRRALCIVQKPPAPFSCSPQICIASACELRHLHHYSLHQGCQCWLFRSQVRCLHRWQYSLHPLRSQGLPALMPCLRTGECGRGARAWLWCVRRSLPAKKM